AFAPFGAPAGAGPRAAAAAAFGRAPRAAGGAAPRAGAAPGIVQGVVGGTPSGNVPPPPNMRTTGTGPVAFFGVLRVARIVMFSVGYPELSTRPMSCFVTTGTLPALPSVVPATVHVTFGIFFGRRP